MIQPNPQRLGMTTNQFDQLAVEQVTGLSREVLRKWELRYQFPQPNRGARGQRLYSGSDVQRLGAIARLQKLGHRVGNLVKMAAPELQNLLEARCEEPVGELEAAQLVSRTQSLLALLRPPISLSHLTEWLQAQIKARGLEAFASIDIAALNTAVGMAWEAGELGVHAEHIYSEALRHAVLHALPAPSVIHAKPVVLLCTPPGELHGLALLALFVQLHCRGANCVNLGTQLPVTAIAAATHELGADIVAVSISVNLPKLVAKQFLARLRVSLDAGVTVWLGGQGCARLSQRDLAAFEVFATTHRAVQRWQELAISHQSQVAG